MLPRSTSTSLLLATTVVASGLLGYFAASVTNPIFSSNATQPLAQPAAKNNSPPKEEETPDDSDDEEEDIADGDLGSVKAGFVEPCKLVG